MISFDSPNAPLQLRGYRVGWKRLCTPGMGIN
jgi:hypothetical protein